MTETSRVSSRSFLQTTGAAAASTVGMTPTGYAKVLDEHKRTRAEDIKLHHTNLRNSEDLNCPVELGMAGVAVVNMVPESWRSGRMMGWDTVNEKMVSAETLDLSHFPKKDTKFVSLFCRLSKKSDSPKKGTQSWPNIMPVRIHRKPHAATSSKPLLPPR